MGAGVRDWMTREADEIMLDILHRRFVLGERPSDIARDLGLSKGRVIGVCDRMKKHILKEDE